MHLSAEKQYILCGIAFMGLLGAFCTGLLLAFGTKDWRWLFLSALSYAIIVSK